MAFVVVLENFRGPFDVLLELLDKRQLDITSVAVGSITSDYLGYIEKTELSLDELNWFLIVATRLALQKSSALLMMSEEENDEDLSIEASLVRFKKIKELSNRLQKLMKSPMLASVKNNKISSPISELDPGELRQLYLEIAKQFINKPKSMIVKTQQRNIVELRRKFLAQLKLAGGYKPDDITATASNRLEAVVGLMTILELLRDGGMKLTNDRYVLQESGYD